MKGWTTATAAGRCSRDYHHGWKAGTRVFRVQGPTWMKLFCGLCARSYYEAGDDTGETHDVTDAPGFPQPLRQLAEKVGERFDAKLAAANDREE